MKKVLFSLSLLLGIILPLSAQTTWKIDPVHSKVLFTVSHLVVSEVTGKFNEFDATLVQSGADFAGSVLTATIQAKSIDTENEKRDAHLRSADFFDVENYPEISFVSKSFEKITDSTYKVTGDLSMHGVTRSIVLDVKYNGTIKGPWGNTVAGFKATTALNRTDFGLKWNKPIESGGILVGETVTITLQVEMVKQEKS